jgi:hypothetical protein
VRITLARRGSSFAVRSSWGKLLYQPTLLLSQLGG